jgi:hypothetical protein
MPGLLITILSQIFKTLSDFDCEVVLKVNASYVNVLEISFFQGDQIRRIFTKLGDSCLGAFCWKLYNKPNIWATFSHKSYVLILTKNVLGYFLTISSGHPSFLASSLHWGHLRSVASFFWRTNIFTFKFEKKNILPSLFLPLVSLNIQYICT